MKPTMKIILSVALVLSICLNLFQFSFNSHLIKQENIDREFNLATGRISGALDSIDNGNYSGYLLAIEHAAKANALSQFSSYPPEANLTGITAEFINEFRNLNIKQKKLADKEELRTLFQKLSSDPTNRDISERIIKLLQKNLTY